MDTTASDTMSGARHSRAPTWHPAPRYRVTKKN